MTRARAHPLLSANRRQPARAARRRPDYRYRLRPELRPTRARAGHRIRRTDAARGSSLRRLLESRADVPVSGSSWETSSRAPVSLLVPGWLEPPVGSPRRIRVSGRAGAPRVSGARCLLLRAVFAGAALSRRRARASQVRSRFPLLAGVELSALCLGLSRPGHRKPRARFPARRPRRAREYVEPAGRLGRGRRARLLRAARHCISAQTSPRVMDRVDRCGRPASSSAPSRVDTSRDVNYSRRRFQSTIT